MMSRNQSYKVAVAIAVLSGASGLIMVSSNPFVFVFSAATAATTNQTGNQTGANATTTASGGGDQATAKMHLGEAIKALQAGDAGGAKLHMGLADKVLSEG